MYRGYTGHEHLYGFTHIPGLDIYEYYYGCDYSIRPHDAFNLINMNGRLYDPVNGRMLSVDNYSHDGLGSQGYNRYSYAHNNPLKYTDPDGENPMLIGALIGAGFDIAIQLIANKGDFDKINWKQVGISAIAGATGAGIGQLLSGTVKLTGITNALANAVAKGAIIGAASGAGASAVTSVMMGRRGWDLVKDIAQGTLIGGAMGGAGEFLKYKWNNRTRRVTPPVTEVTVNVDDVIQELPRPGNPNFLGGDAEQQIAASKGLEFGDDVLIKFEEHAFSNNRHNDLGLSKGKMVIKSYQTIEQNMALYSPGDNTLIANINGIDKSFKVFVQNGKIISMNMYPGISTRATQGPVINLYNLRW